MPIKSLSRHCWTWHVKNEQINHILCTRHYSVSITRFFVILLLTTTGSWTRQHNLFYSMLLGYTSHNLTVFTKFALLFPGVFQRWLRNATLLIDILCELFQQWHYFIVELGRHCLLTCSTHQQHTHTHTTVLLLVWNLAGTTRVSRYQKGKTRKVKTNLDLLEQERVSGSGICWALCKSAHHPRQPRQHPTTQFFTGRMPFLPPSQQHQSTEVKSTEGTSATTTA